MTTQQYFDLLNIARERYIPLVAALADDTKNITISYRFSLLPKNSTIKKLQWAKMLVYLNAWYADAWKIKRWNETNYTDVVPYIVLPSFIVQVNEVFYLAVNKPLNSRLSVVNNPTITISETNISIINQLFDSFITISGGDVPAYIPVMDANGVPLAPTGASVNYNINSTADSLTRQNSVIDGGTYTVYAVVDTSVAVAAEEQKKIPTWVKIVGLTGLAIGTLLGIRYAMKKRKKSTLKGAPAHKKTPSTTPKGSRRATAPKKAKNLSFTIKKVTL